MHIHTTIEDTSTSLVYFICYTQTSESTFAVNQNTVKWLISLKDHNAS